MKRWRVRVRIPEPYRAGQFQPHFAGGVFDQYVILETNDPTKLGRMIIRGDVIKEPAWLTRLRRVAVRNIDLQGTYEIRRRT